MQTESTKDWNRAASIFDKEISNNLILTRDCHLSDILPD